MSDNFDRILMPVYNDYTFEDILNNINYAAYLKEYFDSQIILVTNDNVEIYKLFQGLFNNVIFEKKLIKLNNICENYSITNIIYNKTYSHVDLYTPITINFDSIIRILDDRLYDFFISAENKSVYESFLKSAETLKLFEINKAHNKLIRIGQMGYKHLGSVATSKCFVNLGNNGPIDYLAPFLGIDIIAYKTRLYDNPLFNVSESKMFSKIKTYV